MTERAVPYGASPDDAPLSPRPRLRVLESRFYARLYHDVMDAVAEKRLTRDQGYAYAVLQRFGWRDGMITAPHTTLADHLQCSQRQLRRYLDALVAAGFISEQPCGRGQAKAYTLIEPQQDTGVLLEAANQTPVSAYVESNKTPVSPQQDTGVPANKTPVSPSIEEDLLEEDEEGETRSVTDVTAPTSPSSRRYKPATNPQAHVIDLIRAGGASVTFTPIDGKAIKSVGADPELVAACFVDIYHGRYGDDFMRRRLNVRTVVYDYLDGYAAWKQGGARPLPRRPNDGASGSRIGRTTGWPGVEPSQDTLDSGNDWGLPT